MLLHSLIALYWIVGALVSFLLLVTFYLNLTPIPTWNQISTWGKTMPPHADKGWYMMPKHIFRYFYILACFVNTGIWIYILTGNTIHLKPHLKGEYISPHTTLYILFLSTIQSYRRLYECLFVSWFSGFAVMHIGFVCLGLTFYSFVALSIISSGGSIALQVIPIKFFYSPYVITGTVLFLYASYHQYICHRILADLRNPNLHACFPKYSIPYGGWFRYISGPHYVAEILIYLSYLIISRGEYQLFWLMNLYTTLAMSYSAITTHNWYINSFKNYPKDRKSLIPFIY